MLLEFSEIVPVDKTTVYSFFRTPVDWARLYRAFGEVEDRGDGWFAVPLYRFPIPLIVRITQDTPGELVAWKFRGFFRGGGEVRFSGSDSGTQIDGFEDVSIPRVFGVGPMIERRFLEQRFRKIWAYGWKRLRAMPNCRKVPGETF